MTKDSNLDEITQIIDSYSDEEFFEFCEQILQTDMFCSTINKSRPFLSINKFIEAVNACLDSLNSTNKLMLINIYTSFLNEFIDNVRKMELMNVEYDEGNVKFVDFAIHLEKYYQTFGFNFIINPRGNTLKSIYDCLLERLKLQLWEEVGLVISEIRSIINDRILSLQILQ